MLKKKNRCGQGMVEYVLIMALVALAAIAVFRSFRQDVGTAYQKAGAALIQGVDEGVPVAPPAGE